MSSEKSSDFGREYGILRGFLVVTALAAAIGAVLVPVWSWIQGSALSTTLNVAARDVAQNAEVGRNLAVTGTIELTVELADPSATERLAAALPSVVTAAAVVVIALLLARFAGDLRRGEPFTRRNVWRFRAIAIILVVGSIGVSLAEMFRESIVSHRLAEDPTVFTMTLPLPWIGAALVVGAVAEAFRVGTRLRDDTEGLV